MSELDYLRNRIGILESVLSQLISYELKILQPYSSERWQVLNNINDMAIFENKQDEINFNATKENK